MSEPRNNDDPSYIESADGAERPMKVVLRERKSMARRSPKAMREAAFRERAFMQGMLASCLCLVPLVLADTESTHELWCPAHGLLLSRLAQEKLTR